MLSLMVMALCLGCLRVLRLLSSRTVGVRPPLSPAAQRWYSATSTTAHHPPAARGALEDNEDVNVYEKVSEWVHNVTHRVWHKCHAIRHKSPTCRGTDATYNLLPHPFQGKVTSLPQVTKVAVHYYGYLFSDLNVCLQTYSKGRLEATLLVRQRVHSLDGEQCTLGRRVQGDRHPLSPAAYVWPPFA